MMDKLIIKNNAAENFAIGKRDEHKNIYIDCKIIRNTLMEEGTLVVVNEYDSASVLGDTMGTETGVVPTASVSGNTVFLVLTASDATYDAQFYWKIR